MSQKPVLLFAHRGEAQAFFTHDSLQSVGPSELQAYESEQYFLLITQEGWQDTTENLTWFLSLFSPSISQVINLGLAGALKSTLPLGEVIKIKTIYGEEQFKSFQSAGEHTGLDLISAKNRVTSQVLAQKLSLTAVTVDREAWAMASVSKKFRKDFYCYKLLSDYANHENICELVKEQALPYSEKLYAYFQTINIAEKIKTDKSFELPGFHSTFTQQKQIENLLKRLELKGNTNHQPLIDKIAEMKLTPKEKSQLLIHELTHELNPFKKSFEEKLANVTSPLTQIGCRLKFTDHYENKNFTLTMPIENEKNLERLQSALAEISYQEISKILDGDF